MKTVSIFVAGSTKLREEMTRIKAIISDLDFRYGSRGYRIETSNFANHADNQTTYNDYIRNEADIVLFILKGNIGSITEEEYRVAMDTLAAKKRPEVYVFVNPVEEESPDYQHLLSVIRERMLDEKKYYVRYNDIEDLANKVRSRLDEYLFKREKNPRRSRIFGWLTAAAFAIIASCFLLMRERSEIVYAGGGSVANYLLKRDSINLDVNKDLSLFRRSVYSRLPSGAAWTMLSEDVNLHMLNRDATIVRRKFWPVCLSAGKIDLKVFGSVADQESKQQSAIVECYLGEDPLMVYMCGPLLEKLLKEGKLSSPCDLTVDNCLTPEGLAKLMAICDGKTATAFATNIESGTRKMFFNALLGPKAEKSDSIAANELIYSDLVRLYNESSPSKLILENDENKFVILGSDNYMMNSIMDIGLDIRPLKVHDSQGNEISKSMYLYFVLYKESGNSEKYLIPESFMPILRKLHKAGKIDEGRWNEIKSGRIAWRSSRNAAKEESDRDKRRVISIGLK